MSQKPVYVTIQKKFPNNFKIFYFWSSQKIRKPWSFSIFDQVRKSGTHESMVFLLHNLIDNIIYCFMYNVNAQEFATFLNQGFDWGIGFLYLWSKLDFLNWTTRKIRLPRSLLMTLEKISYFRPIELISHTDIIYQRSCSTRPSSCLKIPQWKLFFKSWQRFQQRKRCHESSSYECYDNWKSGHDALPLFHFW